MLGDERIATLSTDDLERYRDHSGHSSGTVHYDLTAVLSSAWRWAVSEELLLHKFPTVSTSSATTRPKPIPTRAELDAVLSHLDGWAHVIVRLLGATGARIGEVDALRWADMDLETGWVTLNGKTGPRRWPLGATDPALMKALRAASIVRALLAVSGAQVSASILGVSPGTIRGGGNGIHKKLRRACEAAGVRAFSPHAIRRLVSTQLLESGVAPLSYETLMGHSFRLAKAEYARSREATLISVVQLAKVGATGPRGGT